MPLTTDLATFERWRAVRVPESPHVSAFADHTIQLYEYFPALRPLYLKKEIEFEWLEGWLWIQKNSPWLPLTLCAVYLAFCYWGQKWMANRKPFDLKWPLIAWNFGLALFSAVGAFRTMPHLLYVLYKFGFKYTICFKPSVWYGAGAVGWWTQAFCLSKIPELGDTVFIVLRKKPLIFLHWYHHVTVLLYCWHSYYEQTTYGLYFIAMNYSVHAVMYLYYALAAMRIRLCKPYYITTLQISQMFVGIGVCVAGGYYISKGETEYISIENFWAGVIMYTSYAALFLQYAIGRFIKNLWGKRGNSAKAPATDKLGDPMGVTTTNGNGHKAAAATMNGKSAQNGAHKSGTSSATSNGAAAAVDNGKKAAASSSSSSSSSNGKSPVKRSRNKAD